MNNLQRDYYARKLSENERMAEVERQMEADLLQEAIHARDGITPPTRPEPVYFPPEKPPLRRLDRVPDPLPDYIPPPALDPRHPKSVIAQLVNRWRAGEFQE